MSLDAFQKEMSRRMRKFHGVKISAPKERYSYPCERLSRVQRFTAGCDTRNRLAWPGRVRQEL